MPLNSLVLLGSSGSIGRQTLDVCESCGVAVEAISVNTDVRTLESQVRKFSPRYAAVVNESSASDAKIRLADTDTVILSGAEGLLEMLCLSRSDTVLNAIVGQAGLMPTVRSLEEGKRLALANKESLVCAGEIVMRLARKKGCSVLPVDSEHCAIHQCLRSGRECEVDRLILTASGGPFFGKTRDMLKNVTPEMTLRHPTWNMGKKISVDSATMMNKGFEIIEAAHLFGVSVDNIDAVVHRQSVVHSMVAFRDGSLIAQLGSPDMRTCIAYALFYPERACGIFSPFDPVSAGNLTFERPDNEAFPLMREAVYAFRRAGVIPAVMNAVNEEAVYAFLDGKLDFCGISDIVSDFVHNYSNMEEPSLDDIEKAASDARSLARQRLGLL